jgi:2-oxoglutarate ferredoxin oxidoreductase subunit gamma
VENSEKKIVIAGFGGQGIVLIGNIIARAAVIEDRHVVGMVCYGAEMRGGTANATVIVSDELIYNPVVTSPDLAVILNGPSWERFEPQVAPGGTVVMNTSMIKNELDRNDISCVQVDATQIAHQIGNRKVANIVALGALNQYAGLLEMTSIEQALTDLFSNKNPKLVDINIQALRAGAEKSTCIQPVVQT